MAQDVNINCDMGESVGALRMGEDEQVLGNISSANVACGFLATDPRVMDACGPPRPGASRWAHIQAFPTSRASAQGPQGQRRRGTHTYSKRSER